MAEFHSFLWLSNILLYLYHIFFIQSLADGHLGRFPVLAIVSSAAMSVYLFQLVFSFFLNVYPGAER